MVDGVLIQCLSVVISFSRVCRLPSVLPRYSLWHLLQVTR